MDPTTISAADQVEKVVWDVGVGLRVLRVGALVGIPIVVALVIALAVLVLAFSNSSAPFEARPEYLILPR